MRIPFAAIVSGPNQQATIAAAERVRESFTAEARIVDGIPVAAAQPSLTCKRDTHKPCTRKIEAVRSATLII